MLTLPKKLVVACLGAVLLLAGCATEKPPQRTAFAPLHYEFLMPLRLQVAQIQVQNRYAPRSDANVEMYSPVRPVDALQQMANDRLVPIGSDGVATLYIDDASIIRNGNALFGSLAVRLELVSGDGLRRGAVEARVAQNVTNLPDDFDLRGTLYDLTRAMMDRMNVELQYQLQKSLSDWMQPATSTAAPPPAPVLRENLDGQSGQPADAAPTAGGVPPTDSMAPGATPAAPSAPAYPPAPGYQAAPGYQPAPGYQTAPVYPPAPGYQAAPNDPLPPAYPRAPGYQPAPAYPGAPQGAGPAPLAPPAIALPPAADSAAPAAPPTLSPPAGVLTPPPGAVPVPAPLPAEAPRGY